MAVDQDSTEKLHEEILAEARKEGEKIIDRAKQDAEIFLTSAAAVAERTRQEGLERARADAAQRSNLILSTIPVETGRLRTSRIETLLNSVYEEIRQKLMNCENFEYRKTLISLASDAINRMTGDMFVVKIPGENNFVSADDLAEEIARHINRPVKITVVYQTDMTGYGVLVEDGDAHQIWDNRLLKRLERMWPELRRQIAIQTKLVQEK